MRRTLMRGIHLLAIAVCSSLGTAAIADTAPAGFDATVDQAARALMAQHGIPGLAIGVTAPGKRQLYHYGVASRATGQPVTDRTLFEVGSISKTFTATLAASAQASGALQLDASPSRYLPALAGSRLDEVSLLQLATHTAGGFALQLPEEVRRDEQLTDYFRRWSPRFPPGTRRTYANPSIGLLGLATAASLGQPYEAAAQGRLLDPLALHDTYLSVPAEAQPRYAQGYTRDDQPVRLNPAPLAAEAYGVRTTSADLLRFVEAQLGTVEVEPTLTQAFATTRTGHFRVGAMTQALVWEQYRYPASLTDLRTGNGSAMVLESQPVEPIVPPLPPQAKAWINKTGSTNGFGAYVAFVPAEQIGVVILANKYYPNEARVELAYRLIEALTGAP